MIYYDRLIDPQVLELARRDAERVYVGKEVGAHAWPQDRISDVIVAAARHGRSVVRLKSGDPMIFGRAEEEMAAARAAGIPVEIVPGVTAALAASAALGRSLTERGVTDRVTLATGTCRDGDTPPDVAGMLQPGATVALYMAVNAAATMRDGLRAAGFPGQMPVEIVSSAACPGQQVLTTDLDGLCETMQRDDISNPAILILRAPKQAAR